MINPSSALGSGRVSGRFSGTISAGFLSNAICSGLAFSAEISRGGAVTTGGNGLASITGAFATLGPKSAFGASRGRVGSPVDFADGAAEAGKFACGDFACAGTFSMIRGADTGVSIFATSVVETGFISSERLWIGALAIGAAGATFSGAFRFAVLFSFAVWTGARS